MHHDRCCTRRLCAGQSTDPQAIKWPPVTRIVCGEQQHVRYYNHISRIKVTIQDCMFELQFSFGVHVGSLYQTRYDRLIVLCFLLLSQLLPHLLVIPCSLWRFISAIPLHFWSNVEHSFEKYLPSFRHFAWQTFFTSANQRCY